MMNGRSSPSDPYRATANRIANGDWRGKLDFIDLEEKIYCALVEVGQAPRPAIDRFTQFRANV